MTLRCLAQTVCLILLTAALAHAQTETQPLADAPATPAFMARYDFHLSAAGLAVDDDRFSWDTHFGGDFDLVDYVKGRMTVVIDYQAILGKEFRPFDPYQGNYTLEMASSIRAGKNEFAAALHHVSRHLGDRFKIDAVAWNEVDARVLRQFAVADTTIDVVAEAGKVIARAWVDYSWTATANVTARHPISGRVGVFAHGAGRFIGVIEEATRSHRKGGRLDAGVRFNGSRGAVELFAGVERVIDAGLFDGLSRHWAFAGFRFVSR